MTTSTRPIPVPPQGTALHWHLSAPYNAKHLLVLIAVMVLLFVTGQRTEMDRMVAMTAQAVAKTVGLADDSQVARGLSRVGQAMWPPAIAETEEVGRIQDLDRQKLPLFSHIETQERVEQKMNLDKLKMEATTETVEVLVKPVGYVWTVFIKMIETLEIALWGTILSVLVSIPLAYFAARNY